MDINGCDLLLSSVTDMSSGYNDYRLFCDDTSYSRQKPLERGTRYPTISL